MPMLKNYIWDTPRDFDPAAYPEKEISASVHPRWLSVDDPENRPPKLRQILAWDGIQTAESWVNADGIFMRVNATWERVFGTKVIRWAQMPIPEGEGYCGSEEN